MFRVFKPVFMLALFSFSAWAGNEKERPSPVENISVYVSTDSFLSFQNMSDDVLEINIYGEALILRPDSGIQFQCAGHEYLELQIKNNVHGHFEVPCQSRVVISPSFVNQHKQEH